MFYFISYRLTFGFPAIVAFSMDREAYAVMRGSFTEKGISSFLHGVTSGRQRTIKLSQMPNVVTTEPWDGKDGEVVEEEMSLSEILFNQSKHQENIEYSIKIIRRLKGTRENQRILFSMVGNPTSS